MREGETQRGEDGQGDATCGSDISAVRLSEERKVTDQLFGANMEGTRNNWCHTEVCLNLNFAHTVKLMTSIYIRSIHICLDFCLVSNYFHEIHYQCFFSLKMSFLDQFKGKSLNII